MTYREIMAAIEGAQQRLRARMQESALISYRQANLIASLVGITLGSKQKAPSLQEAFPGIFPELEQQPRQQNWQLMKARIDAYAAERRKRGGEADGGNNS